MDTWQQEIGEGGIGIMEGGVNIKGMESGVWGKRSFGQFWGG